jgi:hypothetical protein
VTTDRRPTPAQRRRYGCAICGALCVRPTGERRGALVAVARTDVYGGVVRNAYRCTQHTERGETTGGGL